jgi:hypothetical protein
MYPIASDYAAVDEFWNDGDFTGFDMNDRENFARWRAEARAEERERCLKIIEPYCNSSELVCLIHYLVEGSPDASS